MEELVSVIVPVYKVEKYLDKCISSIVNQTYKNLEIILVDDGSPDNCPQICDEWVKKDTRIKVIHKPNGGLSSARNTGLDICKGEYICFVDSDDWIEPNYVHELYTTLHQNNADMSICGISNINEQGKEIRHITPIAKSYYSNDEKFNLIAEKSIMVVIAWNKMYKKKIWKNLRYPLNKINEDEFVLFDLINNTENGISVTFQNLYNYLNRSNSITHNSNSNGIFDALTAFKERYSKVSSSYLKDVVGLQILSYYIALYRRFHKNPIIKEVRAKYKKDYKYFKRHIHGLKDKIKFFIFNFIPDLLLVIKTY